MCGIVGIINTAGTPDSGVKQIHAMNESQNHRGPDGSGIWISACKHIHLGHKRLSIIDLSDAASQPMMSHDEKYVLVFNGEIYNYKELRADCIKLGCQFSTQSDSEVIIECYRLWGESSFTRLRGMWAFLLYDVDQQKVVVSRDPFAIKPLYYSFFNGHFYFASELKALTGLSGYFKEEDLVTTALFLDYGYLERDDWTFYKHIKRFPHAHYAVLELNKKQTHLSFTRFWQPNSSINHSLSFEHAATKLKELLYDSMKLHLRSDVPVGACLSGGLDSSAIVCMGSRLLNDKSFTTFTTHYPSHPAIDETKWANTVIQHTNAKAYFTEPTPHLFKQSLDDLIHTQDEPFGSMSIFAQYCVFKKISETPIKVVLDGQGADEMLAGYVGFIPTYFDELAKKGKFISLTKELLAFKDMNIQFDAKRKLISMIKRGFSRRTVLNHPTPAHKGELEFRLNKLLLHFDHFEDRLENLLCDSNIPQLLRYEDRNSMRFSIESRVPFLNTELVDFVLSLPVNFRIRHGYTKAVLREALKGLIPETIRTRTDKLGFPAPEIQWLQDCYGITADQACSRQWREFIHTRWRELKQAKSKDARSYEFNY